MSRTIAPHMPASVLAGVLAAATALLVAAAASHAHAGQAPETAADRGPPQEQSLRAMTYNIQHARGVDDEVSVSRIADVIDEADPDVVGLQEVDVHWGERSDFRDQAGELADRLDMHVVFAPIYSFEPADTDPPPGQQQREEYGTAILSDYPIIEEHNHEIMRYARWVGDDPEPERFPGFGEVTINVAGTHVQVFNTHLQSSSNGSQIDIDVRAEQVVDMLELIDDDPDTTLLLGDLNEDRDWPEDTIVPLFDVFTDAWEVAGEGDGYTAYDLDPDRRIDHVLASPDMEVEHAHVPESGASDHFPVVADLTFDRDPGRAGLR
ncbi:metal-dependent hydrolase [Egibacter rhizosphaerae]|uniref:Metal-dependent hydrolase n=1 Tax=Egibacter rhizosphaerae TaxID=1670831 RepID=A0A411YBS2_9ACTN|nr:endonuclease/exonuclease/phosphatase family protein [Egibacter rhizosphaerae]QBI18703.1 metal-dependent hydrolase [Egibacter rhizosphaerae]